MSNEPPEATSSDRDGGSRDRRHQLMGSIPRAAVLFTGVGSGCRMTPAALHAFVAQSVHDSGSGALGDGVRAALVWMRGVAEAHRERLRGESSEVLLGESATWGSVIELCDEGLRKLGCAEVSAPSTSTWSYEYRDLGALTWKQAILTFATQAEAIAAMHRKRDRFPARVYRVINAKTGRQGGVL